MGHTQGRTRFIWWAHVALATDHSIAEEIRYEEYLEGKR